MNQNEPMDKAAKEPEEVRKAKEKAMRLLLQQDRTEKELRDRLYRAGFSETASEAAMQYVSGFGYLDDRRYAENYISFHKGRRSRKEISFKKQRSSTRNTFHGDGRIRDRRRIRCH